MANPKSQTIRETRLKLSKMQIVGLGLGLIVLIGLGLMYTRGQAATTTFRFAAFSDTKTGTSTLAALSPQILAMNPVFGLYPGDLCDTGPDSSCFSTWKKAINGNSTNNLYDRMFMTRGNHDSAGASFWASTLDFKAVATRLGATNFTGDDFTYSFDYGNSHFIGLDSPGGAATKISSTQVTWIDNDLTAAEKRGVTNSFAFFHGPLKPQGGHCCTIDPRFITVFGKHPSFKVSFHGHEHNMGATMIDSRFGNSGKPFLQIITGGAGAGLYACQSGQSDFCLSTYGFAMADVDGGQVKVSLYKKGSTTPIKVSTIGVVGPSPTPTPTPIASSTPTPTPATGIVGDINSDSKVNVFDLSALLAAWGTNNAKADLNRDGTVNVFDLSNLLSRWTG